LVQVSLERALLALTTDDWKAARTALETLYDYEGQDSARVLSVSAQVAYQAEVLLDALNLALMAQAAQADDLPRQGRTAAFLGQVYEKLGERNAAIDQLLGGIKLMGQTGDRYGYARARMNLAAVYLGQGNLRTALDYLRELPVEFEAMGDLESLQATAANLDMLNKATRQWRRGG
jgi:tetratricopeptide (TPR) repeat protein